MPLTLYSLLNNSPQIFGYGDKSTEVCFPLSPNLAFVGTYHFETDRDGLANEKLIAQLNSRTLNNAERFIYANNPKIMVMEKNNDIFEFDMEKMAK